MNTDKLVVLRNLMLFLSGVVHCRIDKQIHDAGASEVCLYLLVAYYDDG